MKFISADLFINVMNEEVLRIESTTPEQVLANEHLSKEAQTTDLLLLVCNTYLPTPGQVLSIQEVRKFHNLMTTLEDTYKPQNDFVVISEEEMAVLLKICAWTLPRMSPVMLRNSDRLLNILEQAPNKKPAPVHQDIPVEEDANPQR